MAIFDAAMKQFGGDAVLGHEFFDMILEFEDVPCLRTILEHVVEKQVASSPESYHTRICHVKAPVAGIKVTSPDFPRAFGTSLSRLKQYSLDRHLAQEIVNWLQPVSEIQELDPALRKVVVFTLQRSQSVLQAETGSEN